MIIIIIIIIIKFVGVRIARIGQHYGLTPHTARVSAARGR